MASNETLLRVIALTLLATAACFPKTPWLTDSAEVSQADGAREAGALLAATSPHDGEPVQPTLVDLGTLGGRDSQGLALNNRGQVVGAAEVGSGATHAFLWERGKMIDLGTLGGVDSPGSWATAVNGRGQVAGYVGVTPAWEHSHAFLWDGGVMVDLGTLGGADSMAFALNDRGQVVGVSALADGGQSAFLWQGGVMTDLGMALVGGIGSKVVNERGQVVGQGTSADGQSHAFLWDHGQLADLGMLPGGWESSATAINERGQVVGESAQCAQSPCGHHAFLWDKGAMVDLGTLGGSYSAAVAINERGQVVGQATTASGATHGFLWEKGRMIDLGTLDGGDWSAALGINERGQVIGQGNLPGRDYLNAFLWEQGTLTYLGTLGGSESYPWGINDRGQVVGTANSATAIRAVVWREDDDRRPFPEDGAQSRLSSVERAVALRR